MTDRRMRDVSHTHSGHETRDLHWFRRGLAIATDGGRREANGGVEGANMRDVSHTPPAGNGADRIWDGTQVREPNDE